MAPTRDPTVALIALALLLDFVHGWYKYRHKLQASYDGVEAPVTRTSLAISALMFLVFAWVYLRGYLDGGD